MVTRARAWNRSVIVCDLLGCALLAGCGESIKDLRAEGIEEYRCHQYIESTATLRHVLELAPNDAQSNYYLGLNYRTVAAQKFSEGDISAARREIDTGVVYFTQAIKSWPNYMAAVSAKTEALEARGKFNDALNVAERVADNNRGIADHFAFLGDEYRDRGDYDNALRAYNTALASDAGCTRANSGKVKLYQRVGDAAMAMEASQKADQLARHPAVMSETIASPQPPTVNHQDEP